MDEIELQLCLDIEEPTVSFSMPPPPLPLHLPSDNACRTDYKAGDQGQARRGQRTPPRPPDRRGKRPAECLGDGIDDEGHCDGEVKDQGGISFPMSGSLGCEDGYEPGSYLRLPPRKRARTLFSFDGRGLARISGGNGVSEDAATLCINGVADLGEMSSSASLPDIGGALDNTQHSEHAVKDMSVQAGNMERAMDIDCDTRTDAIESITSQPPARHANLYRPQLPFTDFPEGAYMPTLLDSLSSPQAEKDRRSHQFSIYEDPEGMDIDGVGYFETGWYLSPEDDKENIEEGDDQQHHRHVYDHEQESEQHQDRSYDLPFDERDSYSPGPTAEQRTLHYTTTARNQSPIRTIGVERRSSQGMSITPSGNSRELEFTSPSGRDEAEAWQFSFLLGETSPPIMTRIDTLGSEYTLPSPTSLSATEVSLRALPSQTAEGDSPTQPVNNAQPPPRPHRRVNRYCC